MEQNLTRREARENAFLAAFSAIRINHLLSYRGIKYKNKWIFCRSALIDKIKIVLRWFNLMP